MTRQARDNKLTIEDMAGGSFTISNVSASYSPQVDSLINISQGGVFGSLMGTPIINLPQTGEPAPSWPIACAILTLG